MATIINSNATVSEFKGKKSITIAFDFADKDGASKSTEWHFQESKAAVLLSLRHNDAFWASLSVVAGVSATPTVATTPPAELPMPPIGNPPVPKSPYVATVVNPQPPAPVATPPVPTPVVNQFAAFGITTPATPAVNPPAPTVIPTVPSPSLGTVKYKSKSRNVTARGHIGKATYVKIDMRGRSDQWFAVTTFDGKPGYIRECRINPADIIIDSAPTVTSPVAPTVVKPVTLPAATVKPTTPTTPIGTVPSHFAPLPVEPGMLLNGYVTIGGLRFWVEIGTDGLVSGMVAEMAKVA